MAIKVKLPLALGLEVSKKLVSIGIPPQKNRKGMLTLEFSDEELLKIEELEIINPSRNILDGIEHLYNLKKLTVNTFTNPEYRQNKNIASISQDDMRRISNKKSLKTLVLINQNGIHEIDFTNLVNLEELEITENDNLEYISGLDKLRVLKSLKIYENKNLFDVDSLNSVIKNNKVEKILLSLIYFSDIVKYDKELGNIDMEVFSIIHNLGDDASFVEVPFDLNMVRISPEDALKFHQNALTIIDNKFKDKTDNLGYIIGIEEYLTRNVSYDYDALSHNYTHTSELKEIGPLYGSNSSYNAIIYKSSTSEGYARAMVYLLKQLGIKSRIVYCHKGNEQEVNPYAFPDDGFHAVVSINDYFNLYCDPCWDASQYSNGDATLNYLPFTLLSKEEISKTHSLMYDEKSTGDETLTVPRKIISTYLKDLDKNVKRKVIYEKN